MNRASQNPGRGLRTALIHFGSLATLALPLIASLPHTSAAQSEATSSALEALTTSGELSVEVDVRSALAELGKVVIYVFAAGSHDDVVTAMQPGERVSLLPGSYDLRTVWMLDSEERDIQWQHDVPVAAGEQVQRRVRLSRGALLLEARNADRPLPDGAVTISLYRAGDEQEEVVGEGQAGEALDAAVGRYDVKATFAQSNDKAVRWLRDLELKAAEIREAQIEFSSGTLTIQAELKSGQTLGRYDVYVYYYRPEDHAQPVAYTPAGEPAVLESGSYDVRAHYFRSHDQEDTWLRDIAVKPGEPTTRSITFPSAELLVRVYDETGSELLGDNVFLYVYAANQRKRALASARGGEILILSADSYDLRVVDTRGAGAELWLPAIRLQAGTATSRSVTLSGGGLPRE
jgi:hypothetical protein